MTIEATRNCRQPILIASESYHNADMYYATGFLAPDRFIYLCEDGREHVIVSQMEYERAKKESRVKDVLSFEDYDYTERLKTTKDSDRATADMLAAILGRLDIKSVRVPKDFSLLLADLLRARGIELIPVPRLFEESRSVKTSEELEKIKRAQAVNEKGLARAIDIIENSTVKDGVVHHEGIPLTAEFLRKEIELEFFRHGYDAESSIVASGPGSADPHFTGKGPIRAGEPIVIDIFPYGKQERYFADMTRTVSKGAPTPEVQKMYDLVLEAQMLAIGAIKAGVTGKYVNDLVCDFFEKHGYGTGRTKSRDGFIHSTGHGVGIEIHEYPSIGEIGLEPLKAGQVVTVEPGLYKHGLGGVRIEDMVVVTETGNINLTKFPKKLVM